MQEVSSFKSPDMSLYKEPRNRCKCGAGEHCTRWERTPGGYVGTCICGKQTLNVKVNPGRGKRQGPKRPASYCGCGNPIWGPVAAQCKSCGAKAGAEKKRMAL